MFNNKLGLTASIILLDITAQSNYVNASFIHCKEPISKNIYIYIEYNIKHNSNMVKIAETYQQPAI